MFLFPRWDMLLPQHKIPCLALSHRKSAGASWLGNAKNGAKKHPPETKKHSPWNSSFLFGMPSHSLWLFWPWLKCRKKLPTLPRMERCWKRGPFEMGLKKKSPRKVGYLLWIRDRGCMWAWDFASGTYWGELKASKDWEEKTKTAFVPWTQRP